MSDCDPINIAFGEGPTFYPKNGIPMKNPRHPIALRIPEAQLQEIDSRARRAKLSRTQYIVRSALGTMDQSSVQDQLDEHAERIALLERQMFGE